MNIEFVASVAVITADPPQSRRLYVDTLGLPLASDTGDEYLHAEIPGTKHFGVWPLTQAAQACFGVEQWPDHLTVPQASVEFDVSDAAAGHALLHPARQEPWGQTVARLLSPEGLILGISYVPSMHS